MMDIKLTWWAIGILLIGYLWLQKGNKITRETFDEEYDYVVVGGGTAGSIVATRLSEDPNIKVLVLEAGVDDADYPELSHPSKALSLWGDSQVDWLYKTTKQTKSYLGSNGQQGKLLQAKVLGGCSSHNCMLYNRGDPEDYNYWSDELGCEGWSYRDVLPYFKKSERNLNEDFVESGYHGDSGPVTVMDSNLTILSKLFVESGEELGYGIEGDINGAVHSGRFMHSQVASDFGVRMSTSTAFLRPAASRSNLHIIVKAMVSKILFSGKKASGIQFIYNGRLETVRAKREVILSAGAFGSPKLLMLSGVGPYEHLKQLGIPVTVDLPVGQNLKDHVFMLETQYKISEHVSIVPEMHDSWLEYIKFQIFGTGVHSSPCDMQGNAFIRSQYQPNQHEFPYIQILLVSSLWGNSEAGMQNIFRSFNFKSDVAKAVFEQKENQHGFQLIIYNNHPVSIGSVKLQSQNPFEDPLIDLGFLTSDLDVKILLDGIRIAQNLTKSEAFKRIGTQQPKNINPDCIDKEYDSDEYWECSIKHIATSGIHYMGTCKMGTMDDTTAVVDSRLRVKGLEGLRVIDASIIPHTVSGNTMAPTMMIAERGADMIKEDAQ